MAKDDHSRKRRRKAKGGPAPAATRGEPGRAPAKSRLRFFASADDWLAHPESTAIVPWGELWRQHWIPVLVLFGLALVVRVLLLVQITDTPYIEVANIDSDSYLTWATEISIGGWLPTRLAYQSPLYAWYLAALQEVFGLSTMPPRIGQVLLGSLSPVLLYAIATRLVGRGIGWIAGIGLCLYGPLLLEEVTISKTTLLVLTSLASFALFLRYAPHALARGLFVSGILFGITVVGVAQWVLGFAALGAYAAYMAPPRARVRAAAAFLIGGTLMVAPIAAWNTSQASGLVLTSGGAGLNFYEGNNERASGLPARPPGLRDVPRYEEEDSRNLAEHDLGRPLGEGEVSRYWTGRALDFIVHNPGAYLVLLGRKFMVLWNGFEVPDNYHFSFMRTHFLPMLHATLDFGAIAPLAIVGLALPFWRRRQLTALYVITVATLLPLLIVYVRSRYRIPAVPFLLVFAGIGLERLRHALATRNMVALAGRGAALVLAALFVNHTYCEPSQKDAPAFCLAGDLWFDLEWLKLGQWYETRGDYDLASKFARRATECTTPRSQGSIQFSIGTIAARSAMELHAAGKQQEALARADEAEAAYRRSLALRFRAGDASSNRILMLGRLGLDQRARAAADEAVKQKALQPSTIAQLSAGFERDGQCASAVRVMAAVDAKQAEQVRSRCPPK